ncbi:choice-of-anchor D domain-containing protein [Planosporangium sp. 12N6]|uniref:choice-of-anchor D domain-containing protein n=1 Tax=Planosporangium spinosum TaxID=3402278 RepID=UPI003CF08616
MLRRRPNLNRWTAAAVVTGVAVAACVVVASRQRPAAAAVSPGVTERVSVATGGGQATGSSRTPAISADGRYVAFATFARLDPLDPDRGRAGNQSDVYVRDTRTGRTVLLSRGHEAVVDVPRAAPAAPVPVREVGADDGSRAPSISGDGRFVAFLTTASNIVDNSDHVTTLVVVDRDPDGDGTFDTGFAYTRVAYPALNDDPFDRPSLSADATRLAFVGDVNERYTVRIATLRHGDRGALLPPTDADIVDVPTPGTLPGDYELRWADSPALSADGSHLVFVAEYRKTSEPWPVAPVFDYDVAGGTVTRLDLGDSGAPIDTGGPYGHSAEPAVSGDGRLVAFTTTVSGLAGSHVRVVDRDPDGNGRYGPAPGEAVRGEVVSTDRTGAPVSGGLAAFSADGRYLAFVTDAAGVHNGVDDPVQYTSCLHPPVIGIAALEPSASPSVPTTGISYCDVVVRDLVVDRSRAAAGLPRLPAELASPGRSTTCLGYVSGATCEGHGDSSEPVLDADGSAVAYTSAADDLVAGDTNEVPDVFTRRFQPVLVAAPVDFGPVRVGDALTLAVPVSHSGFGPLPVTTVTVTGTDFAGAPAGTCTGAVLHEGDRCLVPVTFRPTAAGPRTGTVDVAWRGGPAPLRVTLTGTGVPEPRPSASSPAPGTPGFGAAPAVLDFGTWPVTKQSTPLDLVVTNTGTGPLHVHAVGPYGDGSTSFPGDYRITGETCTAAAVTPGGTCRVTVVFRPLAVGARPAALRFDDDSSLPSPHLIPVLGAGAQPVVEAAPPLAKAGQVTQVTGAAFPPGQTVVLTLDGMPGPVTAGTDADGRFTRPLLILPHTYPGPRLLHATVTVTAGVPAPVTVAATTNYLVVPGSLQPPGFTVRN